MPYLKWDPSYSVNDPFIDSQHKNIIKAINALIDAIDDRKTSLFCTKLHKALESYAERHFFHEEKILLENHFPGLAQHQKEHDSFTKRIDELSAKFDRDEPNIEVQLQMLDFLKEWLYKHILTSDRAYADFIQKKTRK
ncbi:MAG: bacteriohemerythrin [bacterium]